MPQLVKHTITLEVLTPHELTFPYSNSAEMVKALTKAIDNGEVLASFKEFSTGVIEGEDLIKAAIAKHKGYDYEFFFDEDEGDESAATVETSSASCILLFKDFLEKPVTKVDRDHFINLVSDFKDEVPGIIKELYPSFILKGDHPFNWGLHTWKDNAVRRISVEIMTRQVRKFNDYGYKFDFSTNTLYWSTSKN